MNNTSRFKPSDSFIETDCRMIKMFERCPERYKVEPIIIVFQVLDFTQSQFFRGVFR